MRTSCAPRTCDVIQKCLLLPFTRGFSSTQVCGRASGSRSAQPWQGPMTSAPDGPDPLAALAVQYEDPSEQDGQLQGDEDGPGVRAQSSTEESTQSYARSTSGSDKDSSVWHKVWDEPIAGHGRWYFWNPSTGEVSWELRGCHAWHVRAKAPAPPRPEPEARTCAKPSQGAIGQRPVVIDALNVARDRSFPEHAEGRGGSAIALQRTIEHFLQLGRSVCAIMPSWALDGGAQRRERAKLANVEVLRPCVFVSRTLDPPPICRYCRCSSPQTCSSNCSSRPLGSIVTTSSSASLLSRMLLCCLMICTATTSRAAPSRASGCASGVSPSCSSMGSS